MKKTKIQTVTVFLIKKSLYTHQEKKNLMTLKNRLKSIQTSTKQKQKRIWFCIDTPSVDLYYVAEPAIFIYTGNRDHDIVWFTTYLHYYASTGKKKTVQGIHRTSTPQNVPVYETILDPTV